MAKYKCPQCGEEEKLSLIKFPPSNDVDRSQPHDIKCFNCGHNCTEDEKKSIGVE